MNKTGKFLISLDFELIWGVRDKRTIENYGENIMGVWKALPKMIVAFEKYNVKGTFAIVGFLLASNKDELLYFSPENKPNYLNRNLSPYIGHFDLAKESHELDRYHYAPELISLIQKHPKQEIATHTFSHYYCREEGQTMSEFQSDMLAAVEIAKSKNISLKSLIFPRNQFNDEYLEVLKELGITSYRGNEKSWVYRLGNEKGIIIKRMFRLIDSYINISGSNTYNLEEIAKSTPYDIPSSRFLRSFSPKLKILENLKLRRILNGMTYAAKNKEVYHLWWHPHNFGTFQKENFAFLNKILEHYNDLNSLYKFESVTMSELSTIINKNNNE